MTTLPFDELNRFKEKLATSALTKDDRDWIIDDLIGILIVSYSNGCDSVTEYLPGANPAYGEADAAIYKEIAGETWIDRIDKALDGNTPLTDVIRIAETEANRDFNAGGYDTAVSSGATRKTWVTMRDDRVRDTHDYIDGVSAPIDGAFTTYDGDSAQYPGDFSFPENNINCRCYLRYE